MVGVLVLQFPIEEFNRIMTGNFTWKNEGMGRTGETYLVGPDMYMRSRSREFYETREDEAADSRPPAPARKRSRRLARREPRSSLPR